MRVIHHILLGFRNMEELELASRWGVLPCPHAPSTWTWYAERGTFICHPCQGILDFPAQPTQPTQPTQPRLEEA